MKELLNRNTGTSGKNSCMTQESLNTKLIDACRAGYLKDIKRALDMGADVHCNHDSPLRTAAQIGNPLVIHMLIDHGANWKTALLRLNFSGSTGAGVLQTVVTQRKKNLIKYYFKSFCIGLVIGCGVAIIVNLLFKI